MPAHTACEFNLPALAWPDTGVAAADWVAGRAAAFDVEKITKKFYEDYALIFAAVEAAIAAEGGLTTSEDLRMFTQTLVNRLMFLRFLERKGWLKHNGREDYLRALHEAGPFARKSFYQGRLLPLFFEGLATEHHGASPAYGDVPFLNGGLFEPNDLDQRIKDVPYAALGGLIGRQGLFYRYNFTVEESTPLDIEVAVDPEMLGKVFEELVTGRHESGSYYTPRPIVSFMCREALKGYLATKTKAEADAIAALVDAATVTGLTDARARQILEALDALKAVDPACGSGAYLLGLLHEFVAVYRLLYSEKLVKDRRSLYELKLRIISHNLYGVDIDRFATNIAMLRLWLSLEVEADAPLPLPNLDFKIETGDSLLGPDPAAEIPDLFRRQLETQARFVLQLKEKYLVAHGAERALYRKNVREQEDHIAKEPRTERGDSVIDWRIQFAEVFINGNGFDIVVGNPPCVRQEEIKHLKPLLKDYECYSGVADLFVYFYERGVKLLRPGGQFAFITSNKWYRSGYGEKLRGWLSARTRLHRLIDFGDTKVFDAIAYPTIVLLERGPPAAGASFQALTWQPGPPVEKVAAVVHAASFAVPQHSLDKTGWRLEGTAKRNLLDKLRAAGTPLGEYCKGRFYYGIKTGLNDAFVVDRATRDRLIAEHPSSAEVLKPFLRGRDVKRWRVEPQDLWLIFTRRGIDVKKYPAILRHLKHYQDRLTPGVPGGREPGSYEWYEIQDNIAYWQEFEQPKVITGRFMDKPTFAFDEDGHYNNNANSFVAGATPFLAATLNSAVTWYFLRNTCTDLQNGFLQAHNETIAALPIPAATAGQQAELEKLVRRIVAARCKSDDVTALEAEVNERVYRLFGLTREEIALIEEAR